MATATPTASPTLTQKLEYATLRVLLGILAALPRQAARRLGAAIAQAAGGRLRGLRRSGLRNLQIAFPKMTEAEADLLLRRMYRNLGWLMAEFAHMPGYDPQFVRETLIRYEGLDHYDAAIQRGRGVLVLTGHLGAWELSSFVHSLLGRPMGMVIRRLDNPLVDAYVNRVRCMHGNFVLHKDDFARGLLRAMHRGQAVGILMDTNMTPPQGVFVPFFGEVACTASGAARVAQRTGAAVLPGFLFWHGDEGRYVLRFGAPLALTQTGDTEADAVANTALFARVTEEYIRQYPDQWLWLHRRWKTRPPGAPKIY
ncbi:lysophospholipid acyltransferase family protein [Terriglobus sp.]|uniref:lysophospholipid acyltransferase family protein n=1 Tax=Terriglobus sp. TaxID=1889013 RepID=UPI003B00DF17